MNSGFNRKANVRHIQSNFTASGAAFGRSINSLGGLIFSSKRDFRRNSMRQFGREKLSQCKNNASTALLAALGSKLAVVAALVLLTCFPAISRGQTSYGTVVGTITDTTGAVVPGVAITLVNTGTSEQHTTKTDERGSYQFVNLLPGAYKVTFERQGFKRMVRDNVEVKTSTVSRIDLAMEVGGVETQVLVTAAAPTIDTESSTVGAVIEQKVVEETPLNGRNVMNLIALAPGVVPQGSSSGSVLSNQHGGTFSNPAGWGNYQIGGGMSGQSAMYVDGQPLNGTQNNSPAIVPAQDIIAEFRVETNTVSPEFGRFAGGVVNMTTKQGSNSWHGSAYEYLRNKVLNANDFFNNRNGIARPEWTQNQYGFVLGGPIKKDKAFFFAGWEGFRLRLGDPVNTPVPTSAEMGGDFSSLLNGMAATGTDACGNTLYVNPSNPTAVTNIYDPQSHIGCAFAGNKIPSTRWDSTGSYILQHYYPQTTTGFWAGNGASGSDYDQITGRVDYNLSAKQRLFARYTNWTGDTVAEDPFKNGYGKPGEKHQTHMAEIADTYTINDKTIADVRVSYSGMHWDSLPPSTGKDMSVYGGVWADSSFSDMLSYKQNIDAQVPDGPFWGFFMDVTQVSYDNILSLTGSVTRIAGRHTLKFGGEWRYTNFSNNATNQASGSFLFPDAPVYSHYGWSDLLLGLPVNGSTQTIRETGQQMYYGGLYAMDTFQASKKLTLNYGIRWEQPGAFKEHHNLNTVFLPDATDNAVPMFNPMTYGMLSAEPKGLLALVNSSAYKSRYDQELKWNLFVPRVGFAYRVTDKLVAKGGFGMSLLPSNLQGSASPITTANNSVNPGIVFPAIYNPCNPTGTWLQNAYVSWNPASDCSATNTLALPVGRSPGYNAVAYGTSISVQIPNFKTPIATQWNFSAGQDFGKGMSLEAGYVGAKGTHLPNNNQAGDNINQLPESVISQYQSACGGPASACPLINPMTNGLTTAAQAMLPYPQYVGVNQNRSYWGASIYHGLQARFQKRFEQGSYVQAAYTWSKMISDVDSLLGFVEDATSASGPQDQYNHKAERSISGFDVPQRVQISYNLALPFGKGQMLGKGASGVSDKLISGWGLNGITTFQTGFPMAFQAQATTLSSDFNAGTPRPNITAGCNPKYSGSPESRLNKYFDTSCFTQPDNFSFGNAPRNQSNLRAQGIDNWDLSAVKKTSITEKQSLEFRAEFFNLANHVRFLAPNTTVGNQLYGVVTSAANKPRIVQFALRYNF
jgi:hypothetical protein